MNNDRNRTLVLVISGVLIALACCFCLALIIGGGVLIAAVSGLGPDPVLDGPTPPGRTETPGAPPTAAPTLVPPDSGSLDAARRTLQELARVDVPESDPIDLAERLLGLKDVPRIVAFQAEPIPPGTRQTFWVSNVDNNENFQIEAVMVYATDHVYFWVESGVQYDRGELEALVDEFEEKVYPLTREFFGSEWTPGVDGDPHLYMLYARGLGSSVAGYFSSSDEFPSEIYEFSNEHEMFYLSAENLDLGDEFTYGVLAHEFQHMIHWNQDRNEETWMNEGFSEVAAFLNRYDLGGFYQSYVRRPDQAMTKWPSGGGSSGHYGQAFLVLNYFLDRFGEDATKALVANPTNGLESIDEILLDIDAIDALRNDPISADDFFLDWAVTLLLQDDSVADGRYSIRSLSAPPRASVGEEIAECPSPVFGGEVFPYGVDYIRIECSGEFNLTFQGDTLVRVLPSDARSGEFAFWSNRGDESDMTLTRAFDFSSAQGPIVLDYWTWFDIEEGWDYLYVEVSANGGETWQILRTPSGTDEDPSGNSYGWAYTGPSGGSSGPTWIQETIDLSDYAGEEVLIRFEYVTDAAVNGEGLLLDDVTIEAIGYEEDFEDGNGGWEGDGFVRINNLLPQSFRVALVELGVETRVREVQLFNGQSGELRFALGGEYDEAVLVIVSTARFTWQPGQYRVEVVP